MSAPKRGAAEPPFNRQQEEETLQERLALCYLDNSWLYCVAGVAISVPICLKTKSWNPFAYAVLAGTAADLTAAYWKCAPHRADLKACQDALAAERAQQR